MREYPKQVTTKIVGLHNYLSEPFTFYWAKVPYTLEPGETIKMEDWKAKHGAVHMAERWYDIYPTNAESTDPRKRGFYSRHEDAFKAQVAKAIIDYGNPELPVNEGTAELILTQLQNEARKTSGEMLLPEVQEEDMMPGCRECKATGPRHKPTCSKFAPHEKDASQAAKLTAKSDRD